MGAIKITNHGSLKMTDKFLKHISTPWYEKKLKKYAEMGIKALMEATPVDTGKTRDSWTYQITRDQNKNYTITWINTNLSEGDHGAPVVTLLVYGHVTRQGGYVEGNDFVTPAMEPIFDKIAKDAWRELISG